MSRSADRERGRKQQQHKERKKGLGLLSIFVFLLLSFFPSLFFPSHHLLKQRRGSKLQSYSSLSLSSKFITSCGFLSLSPLSPLALYVFVPFSSFHWWPRPGGLKFCRNSPHPAKRKKNDFIRSCCWLDCPHTHENSLPSFQVLRIFSWKNLSQS